MEFFVRMDNPDFDEILKTLDHLREQILELKTPAPPKVQVMSVEAAAKAGLIERVESDPDGEPQLIFDELEKNRVQQLIRAGYKDESKTLSVKDMLWALRELRRLDTRSLTPQEKEFPLSPEPKVSSSWARKMMLQLGKWWRRSMAWRFSPELPIAR